MSRYLAHQRYSLSNGKIVAGTTSVINNLGWNKDILMGWVRKQCLMGNDPNKIKDSAANIGTIAHGLVEEHIREKLNRKSFIIDPQEYAPTLLETANIAFNSYLEWEELNKVEYHYSEVQLVSEELEYGGTIDIVATVNGVKYLIDIKTSSGVYNEHIIQLAAYHHLYLENYSENLKAMILHLDKKDGSFSPHYIPDTKIQVGFEIFTHLLELNRLKGEL